MDERSVLISQIEVLADNLHRADQSLDSDRLDTALRDTVRTRFANQFNKQKRLVAKLRQEVERGQPMDLGWDTFRQMAQECAPLFSESLAFLQGALVRSAGLDGGICQITDGLLNELEQRTGIHWAGLTILGEGEHFNQTAGIIRVRFPEFNVWNLPVAGHEFGHLAAQEMNELLPGGKRRFPFQDFLDREKRLNPLNEPFLHELFSDLFGAYTLGPAFACTCILLRFDPYTAYAQGTTHPGDAWRVHFILGTLKKMNEAEGMRRPYNIVLEPLQEVWQACLQVAGQPERLDDETVAQLNEWLAELYELPSDHFANARYHNWSRALQLSEAMLADDSAAEEWAAKTLDQTDSLSDVLNAAWLCRLQLWDEGKYTISKFSAQAVKLCRAIIQRAR